MAKTPVLIVEDEPDIADLIRFHLDREGFETAVVQSGKHAMEAVKRREPALVILDLMLPDIDGLEICRRLKWNEDTRSIPILIVSAKGEESDIVTGLELGADDYITKPFSPKVLMARVKNIVRRTRAASAPTSTANRITLADRRLIIDSDRHVVSADGQEVDLTRTEFEILRCLALRPGFVRTRDQIISAVHGVNAVLASRTVDVHVTAIRKKLGDLGRMIDTVRGVGYRLNDSLPTHAEQGT
ncbi:MAG: response regulator transcription factor [Phycisphaerales bacterium]|nr:response regulator transcription factor [Phycisphaerales bacterium]